VNAGGLDWKSPAKLEMWTLLKLEMELEMGTLLIRNSGHGPLIPQNVLKAARSMNIRLDYFRDLKGRDRLVLVLVRSVRCGGSSRAHSSL
jgi:hypothetical protein